MLNAETRIPSDHPLYNNADVWLNIFMKCQSDTLAKIESVCKAFQLLSAELKPTPYLSNLVWKKVLIKQFPSVGKALRLWDEQKFGDLSLKGYKELFKQIVEISGCLSEKTEHQTNSMERCRYLLNAKKVVESCEEGMNLQKISLSFQQVLSTPKENILWCHQAKGLSTKMLRSYAFGFLINYLNKMYCETRNSMNPRITTKHLR